MKKIPRKVKIGIDDWKESNNDSDETKKWLEKYNIQYYKSDNTCCLQQLSKAKNLKVIYLYNFPSCEEKQLKIFFQLKSVHTLYISFRTDVM